MALATINNMAHAAMGQLPIRLDFSGVYNFFAAADEAEASEVELTYGERIQQLCGASLPMKLPADSIYPQDKIGLIMAMMDWSDVDPLGDSFNRFYKDVQERANDENRGVITLDIIKRTTRRQTTALKNDTLRGNTSMFLFALTQSAKTILMLLTLWKAGVMDKRPSIVFSFNRCNERARYIRSAKKLNKMIDKCAEILGMTEEEIKEIPRLSFTGNDTDNGTEEFVKANKKFFWGPVTGQDTPTIPIHVALTNPSNVVKVRKMFEISSQHMDDDRVSKKNCNLVFEEGDLSIKDPTKKLHQVLYTRSSDNEINILTEPAGYVPVWGSNPSSRSIQGDSFMDGFTSQMFVTATPQIFAQVEGIVGGREVKVVKAAPSTNYWSFVCGSEFGCKTIGRKDADSYTNMLADFGEDLEDRRRVGLVCASGSSGITTRTIDNQKILARSAAENYPRMVAVAWNGINVHVYTQRQDWADAFGGCGLFQSQNFRNGVHEFVGKKKVKKEEFGEDEELDHICSYMGVTTYMADNAEVTEQVSVDSDGNILPKITHICLFSFNMTGRSTPIKSYRHTFGLTDMFLTYSGMGGHDESREQIAGRLSTIDNLTAETGMKTLWGPKEDNDKLMAGFERLSILLKIIEDSTTTEEIFANMKRECADLGNGDVVRDEYGVMSGNCGEGTTRITGIKRANEAMGEFQNVVNIKGLGVADQEHQSEYSFNAEWTNPAPAKPVVVLRKPVVFAPVGKKTKVVPSVVVTTVHDKWEVAMGKVLAIRSYSDMNGIFDEHPGFEAYFKGCFELFLSPMGYKNAPNIKGKKDGVIAYDEETRKAIVRGGKKKATAAYNAMVDHAREKADQDAKEAQVSNAREASYAAQYSAALGGGGSGSGVPEVFVQLQPFEKRRLVTDLIHKYVSSFPGKDVPRTEVINYFNTSIDGNRIGLRIWGEDRWAKRFDGTVNVVKSYLTNLENGGHFSIDQCGFKLGKNGNNALVFSM